MPSHDITHTAYPNTTYHTININQTSPTSAQLIPQLSPANEEPEEEHPINTVAGASYQQQLPPASPPANSDQLSSLGDSDQ